MGPTLKYSPEFRQRPVRLMLEQRQDYPSEFEAISLDGTGSSVGDAVVARSSSRCPA